MIKKLRYGIDQDRMPNIAFKMMATVFKIRDCFFSLDKLLDQFEIEDGQAVIDYGCGTGTYVGRASRLAGEEGKVFAVDIHELAIKEIDKKIRRENLNNVVGILAKGNHTPLEDDTADIIYALDVFHMVSDPHAFLKELNRISKPDGVLYIGDGHQPRDKARGKILSSEAWSIVEENKRYLKCTPVIQGHDGAP